VGVERDARRDRPGPGIPPHWFAAGGIENLVKRDRRRSKGCRHEGDSSKAGGREGEKDVFTEQFGTKSALRRGRAARALKSGQWRAMSNEADRMEEARES